MRRTTVPPLPGVLSAAVIALVGAVALGACGGRDLDPEDQAPPATSVVVTTTTTEPPSGEAGGDDGSGVEADGSDDTTSRIYSITKNGLLMIWDMQTFDIIYQKHYHMPCKFL